MTTRLHVPSHLLCCGALLVGLTAAGALGQLPGDAGLKGAAGPRDHIIFFNGTQSRIQYRVSYKGVDQVDTNDLDPGAYHLWRVGRGLVCRYGDPAREATLREGAIYEFRTSKDGRTMFLVRFALLSADDEGEARGRGGNVDTLRQEVRHLTAQLAALQQERDAAIKRLGYEDKLRQQVAELNARKISLREEGTGHRRGTILHPANAMDLSSAGETLTVMTWPAGAPVYLTYVAARHPWAREYLGTTPIRLEVPAGMYQVVVVQPRPSPGRWSAPGGQGDTVSFGKQTAVCLLCSCTKQKGVPVLIRGLWLPLEGTMTERLTQATAGAADLVSLPPEATFEEVCYQAFGRARIELGEGEVKKMYAVLRRTGYLRYEVDGREGIDVEFDPASSKQFRFTVARLAR